MQVGQVFKVDSQAITELAKFYKRAEGDFKSLEGVDFSVAKSKVTSSVTENEVRGTKWVDGKPQRGRPRKFPRATVARLLGETDDVSLQAPTESAEAASDDAELEDAADELVATASPSESTSENDSW